jgi:hypothetical protein
MSTCIRTFQVTPGNCFGFTGSFDDEHAAIVTITGVAKCVRRREADMLQSYM